MTAQEWLELYDIQLGEFFATDQEKEASHIIRDQQAEISRLRAVIAELKEADRLYEVAETGDDYSDAHQKYQDAVKELFRLGEL